MQENLSRGGDTAHNFKNFLGKKAVGRLGCYACHDIPGFDNAKPIGVALNDWGKKDPNRLAFDNIKNFLETHYESVPTWSENGKLPQPRIEKVDGKDVKKMPYEAFFYNDLKHEGRTGYLHQKILDPRSYDYGRIKSWDDRARMPQFRFARAHPKADESEADFEARAWKEEADAREAVMAFILGLVAEQVPQKMINQPRGDRLMEVKGRQVLDKFNCAGCHLVRPGAYDFRVTPESLTALEKAYKNGQKQTVSGGMHTFPTSHFWTGKNPTNPERLVAAAVRPRIVKQDPNDEDSPLALQLVLAEALRFAGTDPKTKERALLDIPVPITVTLPFKDVSPALKDAQTLDEVERVLSAKMPFGGTFADLMVPYLVAKDKDVYKPNAVTKATAGEAEASLPPSLIGEGDRTQPRWLYQFLLDPSPVRRMSILRMPKFNMSPQEAEQLVDYFAGVERITNPGIGLTYPGAVIPQQVSLNDVFWVQKNSAYLDRLKNSEVGKGTSQYAQRLKAYAGAWQEAAKLGKDALQIDLERGKQIKEENLKQIKELRDEAKKLTDDAKKGKLDGKVSNLEAHNKTLDEQIDKLEKSLKETNPEAFKMAYNENQAYVADAYRLIANKQMCLQCHQVGPYKSSNPTTQGPPLALAHERLRPDWVLRWIATPQRHLTYESLMPVNFKRLGEGEEPMLPEVFTGQPLQQIEAIRDVLMNYPRIVALPVNQQWNPNLQSQPEPAGEKK